MTSHYDLDEREGWLPHLQTLHKQFYEHAEDRCLLWVNPAQSDPFADDPLVEERRVRVPIQHPNFNVRLAPYLIPLDLGRSRDAEIFKRSVARAWNDWKMESLIAFNGQAIGGWIGCQQSAEFLARHWAMNCHIHRTSELTKLLRFHDPSVREWLWPLLTPLQQRRLLGPAAFIVAVDRRQELMMHTAAPSVISLSNTEIGSTNDDPPELSLTQLQWDQVDDYAVVHRAWLYHRTDNTTAFGNAVDGVSWWQSVLIALRKATDYGIFDAQDRELFARHVISLGADFDKHEKMRAVWEKTMAGEFYGAAFEDISGCSVNKLLDYLNSK